MFRRSKLTFLNTKDDRIKIINERINSTEKHLIEMCSAFANCTRKLAKYRDAYDELFKCFKNYTDDEEVNESFCDGMKNFCNAITILADYMDLNVHRLEVKIINELGQFDNLCKTTRDNLRTAVIARDKEVLKQRQMLDLKTKFSANNTAADSELLKAKMEVNRTNKEIDEIIYNFEKRKLSDLKQILIDFLLISMKNHTKSLEALTASYYDISNIDEKADLMDFQKLIKSKIEPQDKKLHKKAASLRSQSMESLDRDQLLSPLKRTDRLSKSTKNLADNKTDDEDDDEDEDEIDEEEEEEEDASDSSKSEEDSVTEAEDVDEATDMENASNTKTNKLNAKKPLAKPQVKHPFKAVAATHVLKNSLKQNQNAFATKRLSGSTAAGIPRLVTSNREKNKFHAKKGNNSNSGDVTQVQAGGGSSSRRLVTVVESKKKSTNNENATDNIIDCTRNIRN